MATKRAGEASCIPFITPPTFPLPQGRICAAPFCNVTFPDFWIADQLNSLSTVFLDVEFLICSVIFGDDNECSSARYGIRAMVAVLPAWFRFAQCLRRFYSTKRNYDHLINAGKYSTSFFVVLFSSLASGLSGNRVGGR